MKDDKKPVIPDKQSGKPKGGLKLLSASSVVPTEEIQRPRPMTSQEARWIAAGKKMKLV